MIPNTKLKDCRKKQGMTQENLASISGISIRTIQRIEKGLSNASPYTMKQLAKALEVEVATLVREKEEETSIEKNSVGILKLMNISALTALLLPFGNIIFPLIVFLKNKEDAEVNLQGRKILSFQIVWVLLTFLLLVLGTILLLSFFEGFRGSQVPVSVPLYFISAIANAFIVLYIGVTLDKGKPLFPSLPNFL
ncbi:MAG: helix-turn-helix domain-containing protein [Chitinophagales bacterium]